MTINHSNGDSPDFLTALLAPSKGTRGSRRAWGIDVETIWVPYFTGTNVEGKTELPDDVLGAPIRLAKTRDGEVRFDNNGRPRMRVAPELNAQVTLVRENFVSALMARVGLVIEERPDEYRQQVAAAQLAGQAVMEQQAHDVAVAAEMLRLQQEADAKAVAAEGEHAPEPETPVITPAHNRRNRTPEPEHVETPAS
jgi:hypothetical protein